MTPRFTPPMPEDGDKVVRFLEAAQVPCNAHEIARGTDIEFLTICGVAEMGGNSLLEDLEEQGRIVRLEEPGRLAYVYAVPEGAGS